MSFVNKNKTHSYRKTTKASDELCGEESTSSSRNTLISSRSNGTSNLDPHSYTNCSAAQTPSREAANGPSSIKTNGSLSSSTNKNSFQKFQRPSAVFAKEAVYSTNSLQRSMRKSMHEEKSVTPRTTTTTTTLRNSTTHPSATRSLPRTKLGTITGTSSRGSTPKINAGTPRPIRRDSSPKRISTRMHLSVEDCSYAPNTSNISISVTTPTSARKSYGTASRSVRVDSRRKSYSHYYKSSPSVASFPNTPNSCRKRYSHHGVLVTPTTGRDFQRRFDTMQYGDIFEEEQHQNESSRVSVGVRVRPLNEKELRNPNIQNIVNVRGNEIDVDCGNDLVNTFAYDHCLWSVDNSHPSYASQESVYLAVAKPLLDHATEGYNVCLFAYGQTGSGKSYTIMGENDNSGEESLSLSEEDGVIPRFCQDLFHEINNIHASNEHSQDTQRRVIAEISYIEVYNEKIYDLIGCQCNLHYTNANETHVCASHGGEKREALRVREHPVIGPYVEGTSKHIVASYQDLHTWIQLGNKRRSIAATGMNSKSSRSHSLFSIKVTQTQVETVEGEEMEHSIISNINIVDLAGSERVAASNSEGDRLREGVSINLSLHKLGKVITALVDSYDNKNVVVPYRESVLTFLLKESLGGNSKTSMIATISPCNTHKEETLSTLRYAFQARKIVNWNHINEDPASRVIRTLKLELEKLRAQKIGDQDEDFSGEESKKSDNEDKQECKKETERQTQLLIEEKEKEINKLKETLKAMQDQLSQRNQRDKLLEEKCRKTEASLKEAQQNDKEIGLAIKVEDNQPVLIKLCEDRQLSENVLYNLKRGSTTTLGQSNADINLDALHNEQMHCSIVTKGTRLWLHCNQHSQTFVNGKLVSESVEVFHNDRIVLSGIYFFRICYPSSQRKSSDKKLERTLNFDYAKEELLKEQELRLREEMKQRMDDKEEEKANLLKELEAERHQIEEQKLTLLQLEEQNKYYEERMKNLAESNDGFDSPSSQSENNDQFYNEMEAIFNESVQVVKSYEQDIKKADVELYFKIQDANRICKKISKPYEFQQKCRLMAHSTIESGILVLDLEHNLSSYISVSEFEQLLNYLRDFASGNVEDEDLIKESLKWDRSEEQSNIPGIINRLDKYKRLSFNASLNASIFNVSVDTSIMGPPTSPHSRKIGAKKRRSNMNQSMFRNTNLSIANSSGMSSSSMAKYIGAALPNVTCNDNLGTPIEKAVRLIIVLMCHLQNVLSANQEPGLLRSEDSICHHLIHLSHSFKEVSALLDIISTMSLSRANDQTSQLQSTIGKSKLKLARKVQRLMVGFEKEVDSIIEEEGMVLNKFILQIIDDLSHLNAISGLPLLSSSALVSNDSVRLRYLTGISNALEELIKKAVQSTKIINQAIDTSTDHNHEPLTRLNKNGINATLRVSVFLERFSQLKVVPTLDAQMTADAIETETNRFMGRVSAALDNVHHLISTLENLHREFMELNRGHLNGESFGNVIMNLQESLGELVDDAGIGSTLKSSPVVLSPAEEILQELHQLAMNAFKAITNLQTSVLEYDSHSTNGFSTLGPHKSSLKNTNRRPEEKKVRFNVSLGISENNSWYDITEV